MDVRTWRPWRSFGGSYRAGSSKAHTPPSARARASIAHTLRSAGRGSSSVRFRPSPRFALLLCTLSCRVSPVSGRDNLLMEVSVTKSERALLEMLRGLGIVPAVERPAAASPLPAWVPQPKPAAPAAPEQRTFSLMVVKDTTSGNGRHVSIVQTINKNGGIFQSTVPVDLCKAIEAGLVTGPDGKPVRFAAFPN